MSCLLARGVSEEFSTMLLLIHLIKQPMNRFIHNASLLQAEIGEVIENRHGHKVILQLLRPFSARYFSPEVIGILKPPTKRITKRLEGEEGEEPTTIETVLGVSKKDNILRRQEILKDGLWKAIAGNLKESAHDLICKQYASDVVVEACIGGEDDFLGTKFGEEDIDSIHDALVSSDEDILTNYFGSRSIRRIVLASQEEQGGDSARRFTEKLWRQCIKGKCSKLKESHAAKILAAMVYCGCPNVVKGVKKELKMKEPEKWADEFVAGKRK